MALGYPLAELGLKALYEYYFAICWLLFENMPFKTKATDSVSQTQIYFRTFQ